MKIAKKITLCPDDEGKKKPQLLEQQPYVVACSTQHGMNRPEYELTPRSWTQFKGVYEKVLAARSRKKQTSI